jgi:voltage-gated potassium channel Kch
MYATAGYEAMELWRRRPGRARRAAYWILKLSCGYGYRPARSLAVGLFVLTLSTALYWGLALQDADALGLPRDKCDPAPTAVESLGYSAYLSVITFTTTGYGDVTPKHPAARITAGAEAVSGIVLFSLFIFAMTKRYASLR